MNRTVFLVDGINLYHSLIEAGRDAQGATTKWLDLRGFCCSYLPVSGQVAGERAVLERIYWLSASPIHRTQDKIDRHTLYVRCLRATGVDVELGRFKKKSVYCEQCHKDLQTHEECVNSELSNLAPESFSIKLKSCLRNQFPDPLVLPDGTQISKPLLW